MTCARPAPEAGDVARWRDVSVRYPWQTMDAVGPVSLGIRPGERVLLLGPSGSGKSTLLNTLTGLVPGVIPARLEGRVTLFGRDVGEQGPAEWSGCVARLFQDAGDTLCGMSVGDEIAFALENRGLPEPVIGTRVAAAMTALDLPESWRNRRSATLSGGEKQLVAFAATLAQDAPVFVADEPTAHLAPAVASRLRRLFARIDPARTLIVIDHRIDGLVESIDRVVVLGRNRRIVAAGPPGRLFRGERAKLDALGVWRPLASALDARLSEVGLAPAEPPLSVAAALAHLDPPPARKAPAAVAAVRAFAGDCLLPPEDAPEGGIVAQLHGAACAPFLGPVVLRDVSLAVRRGEAVAVLGRNGAGKSTLGASLAGILRLRAGRREGAPGGMAFQNPESQFTGGSVREEIVSALPRGAAGGAAGALLERWNLAGLDDRHPFELSHGQKRRLALATLTANDRWPLLVLDEPTAGLDAAGAAMIARHVAALRRQGRAILVVTHELDFALGVCPRAVVVGDGAILADGPAQRLLRDAPLLARAGLEPPAVAPALDWLDRHG